MKSAMVSRQGSTSRLQGPRSLTSFEGSPRKRTSKSVKFDKTDEVIQYTAATPDVSEDNWDQISLENCDSDSDGRPLPTLPPFSLSSELSLNSISREERLMQAPQFRAKLGAPLGEAEDDFDFGPELPSPSSSPQKYLANSALGSKRPIAAQERPEKQLAEDDLQEVDLEPAQENKTLQLLPPLQADVSPIIDRPPMELRMDAILDGGSGLSPSLGLGSWHRRTGSEMSDFSMNGNESYLPMKRITPPKEEEEDAPATWRGDSGSVLARQDSLQEDQRHPPTQVVSDGPPPAATTVNRTYSKRKRELQQMLDPHSAGTAQSTAFTSIPEEDEEEPSREALEVDVGDDSYWRGAKGKTDGNVGNQATAEEMHDSADVSASNSSEVGNNSEANQSIGISKEPAAQFAAGLSPALLEPQEDTLESLSELDHHIPVNSGHRLEPQNSSSEESQFSDELAPPFEPSTYSYSAPPHRVKSDSLSLHSMGLDRSSDYSLQAPRAGASEELEDELNEPDTAKNVGDESGPGPAEASQDASRITYYDSQDLDEINENNDYSWDRSAETFVEAPQPRVDASSPKSLRDPAEPTVPAIALVPSQEIVSQPGNAARDQLSLNSATERASTKNPIEHADVAKEMYPGVLPWDPSADTTFDYLSSMPTPVIPQRSPERKRRPILADLGTLQSPGTSQSSNSPYSEERGDAQPRPEHSETESSSSAGVPNKASEVLWEPENDGDDEADWEDEEQDNSIQESVKLMDGEHSDRDASSVHETDTDSLSSGSYKLEEPSARPSMPASASLALSPVYSLPDIPQDSRLSEEMFAQSTEAQDETNFEQYAAALAAAQKVPTQAMEREHSASLGKADIDPDILKFISDNDSNSSPASETSAEDTKAEDSADPNTTDHRTPDHKTSDNDIVPAEPASSSGPILSPHAYTVRQASTSSLRENYSFVPKAAPTLSPVNISTSPFMSSRLEDEIKEQQATSKPSGIDELVTSPLAGQSNNLGLAAPSTNERNSKKGHSASPSMATSMATENGDTSILKEMSFNNEELAEFQRKSLLEEQSREQEADLYDGVRPRDEQPELDSDLSDFEPDAATAEGGAVEGGGIGRVPLKADIVAPESSADAPGSAADNDNIDGTYQTKDPKRDSALSMATAQTTIDDGDVSIREPSFGENMASTMQTLLSDQFPPTAAVSDDFSSRRHSYTLRESGSYVIATSPQKKARGHSHVYEVFNEDDTEFATRQQVPIPRTRPLPAVGSFGTYSSLPRPPSAISQTNSSNYSLAQGSSSNSVAQAWWPGKPMERHALSAIPEPEEEAPKPVVQVAEPESQIKAMRLRPSTTFSKEASRAPSGPPGPVSTAKFDEPVNNTKSSDTAHQQALAKAIAEPALQPVPVPVPVPNSASQEVASTAHNSRAPSHSQIPHAASQPSHAPNTRVPQVKTEPPVKQASTAPVQAPVEATTEAPSTVSQAAEGHDAALANLDSTTSSSYQFPIGLLYIAFQGIMLPNVPEGVLVTLFIDNGVHCIASKAMPASKFVSFKEEYRIGFIQHCPVTAVLKLSMPANVKSRYSIKERDCGSDGSYAKIELQSLRKAAFGKRCRGYELSGHAAWAANKQMVVAKATTDVLYVPCVSRRERPPPTLDGVDNKIVRAREELRSRPPRAQGVLRQYGGDVRPKSGKQRYVVLDPVAPLLVAHSIRTRRARTLINLVKAIDVTSIGDNSLEIQFRNRDALRFRANSPLELELWYKKLRESIGQSSNSRPKWIDAVLYESR